MGIEIVCCTDTGRIRDHNEDCIAIDESLGIAILADGMGGGQAGEIASEIAVTTIMEQLLMLLEKLPRLKYHANHHFHSATLLLEQAIFKANQVIYKTAKQQRHYRGMGTTVVAVLFHQNFISIAHVGDSRLYRLRDNKLCQLTTDHSVNQELIECGTYTPEQARHSVTRHLITRALGLNEAVNIDIQETNILAQDTYLLCSDGLTDMLEDKDIYTILRTTPTLKSAAQFLIDTANIQGGEDNISLILARPSNLAPFPKNNWLYRLFCLNKNIQ